MAMNWACERKTCCLMVKALASPVDEEKKTYSLVRHAGVDLAGDLSSSARASGLDSGWMWVGEEVEGVGWNGIS